jgi:hypothetical protein
MKPTEQNTKAPRSTGLFAALRALFPFQGSGAISYRMSTCRPIFVVVLAIAACAWIVVHTTPAFAAGDATAAECPFETEASPGFRTWLPECRAYELAEPTYAAGAIAQGPGNAAPPISPDGNHVLAISFGSFAETEELSQDGTELGEMYELSRTATGWAAEPQDPPASVYPFHFLELNPRNSELDRSLWVVPDLPQPGEASEKAWEKKNNAQYIIHESGRRFATVGPAVAPGHETTSKAKFSYANSVGPDATHIVFSVVARLKQLWPGDNTEDREVVDPSPYPYDPNGFNVSLYEYRGVGSGEPVLVGVKNEGVAPWAPGSAHVNEGAQLVSDCGTEYSGASADGERVFFRALHREGCTGSQPEVNELYARVGGQETVDISEPSTGPTGDCEECDESVPMEAKFAGASEGGSEVFFTSEQGLLPGANGVSLYEYDFDASEADHRVKLVAADITALVRQSGETPAQFVRVAADGTRVYFESEQVWTGGPNGNGEMPAGGVPNLYVYDTESEGSAFVAQDDGDEEFKRQSFDVTDDGQYAVFRTASDLVGTNDRSTVPQLFEYDAVTGGVVRVSSGQSAGAGYLCGVTGRVEGFDCDGNTEVEEDTPKDVQKGVDSVSGDGTVVFTSELPLAPGAVQGRRYYNAEHTTLRAETENVYEFSGGQVYLISSGDEPSPALYQGIESGQTRLFGIDESGGDVFFSSADNLVPQDLDSQSSWYDARVDGGFPGPVEPAVCSGEACQSAAPAVPVFAAPGSNTLTGSGNLAPPAESKPAVKPAAKPKAKPCKKGFVKKKNRCVKAKSKAKAKKSAKGRK